MGAFDTVFNARGLTPNNTIEATLFTVGVDSAAGEDAQVNVNVSVVGSLAVSVRVGFTPAAGSPTIWVLFDDNVEAGDPIVGLGPLFLQPGSKIQVRTADANNVTFSVTGTNSSP